MKHTGKTKIDLEYGIHKIEVVNTYPLLISLNDEPIRALKGGNHRFVLRGAVGGLQVDPTEAKTPYQISITSRPSQKGEQMDDLPPPQPAPPDNFLAKIREQVRQSMGVTREAFSEFQTPYEMGDTELFEEELAEKGKRLRKEAQKQADQEKAAQEKADKIEAEQKPDEGPAKADQAHAQQDNKKPD